MAWVEVGVKEVDILTLILPWMKNLNTPNLLNFKDLVPDWEQSKNFRSRYYY